MSNRDLENADVAAFVDIPSSSVIENTAEYRSQGIGRISEEDDQLGLLWNLFPDAIILEVVDCELIHPGGGVRPCDCPRVESMRLPL